MKLVINSNLNYKIPLFVLFESLVNKGFKRFEEIILVVGQSENDSPPEHKKVSEIIGLGVDSKLTLINSKLNNYDYGGYHAINLYRDHPMVRSESFMYLLDTTTVDGKFINFFNSFSLAPDELFISNTPHSNICVFGNEVVKNYGDNFGTELTKDEAIRLEWEAPIEKPVRSIVNFGKTSRCHDRIVVEELDIYKTNMPRVRAYYPDFGINKWIFWGRNGDITGRLEKNNPFPESEEDGKIT